MTKISYVNQISEKTLKKMEDGLKEYELSHGIHVDYTPFAFEIYNENGDVIGVLDAFSSYSSIHFYNQYLLVRGFCYI